MKRSILLMPVTAWCCIGLSQAVCAGAVADTAPVPAAAAAPVPAKACLSDVSGFNGQMQKDGYWLGGSAYGYGYPLDGYGYGYGYTMGGYPPGSPNVYLNARSGYEVRTLLAAARILGQDGDQSSCEAVLGRTRDVYKRYSDAVRAIGMTMADGPDWQRQQIAAAISVKDRPGLVRSDQLLDTDVRDMKNEALGSVHDLVISPKTGKIVYLIVARGGLFGFDRSYVPVPWDDFKAAQSANFLVLDTTKAMMDAAPKVTDDQFNAKGQFSQESEKVDAYWKAQFASIKSGG